MAHPLTVHGANDTGNISQRRDESIQDTQDTVVALVARMSKELVGVAQRRDLAFGCQRLTIVSPVKHDSKEAEEPPRRHYSVLKDLQTTISPHVIQNGQEKTHRIGRLLSSSHTSPPNRRPSGGTAAGPARTRRRGKD